MSSKSTGYIYVITNKAMPGIVKIGYSKNVSKRVNSFYSSNVPFPFEVYATLEGVSESADKEIHKMLPVSLRVNDNREFFNITPEYAYDVLFQIAKVFGVTNRLRKWDEENMDLKKAAGITQASQIAKRPKIDFIQCGLKIGDPLVCDKDSSIVVYVADGRNVTYNGKKMSLAEVIRNTLPKYNNQAATSMFMYNGEYIGDIACRTQWKGLPVGRNPHTKTN